MIAIYDLQGYFITKVQTVKEAKNLTNAPNVSLALNGYRTHSGDFQFRRFTKIPQSKIGDVSNLKTGNTGLPVAKYYEGKFICSYDNMNEAAEKNNLNRGSVNNSCEKGHRAGIYHFKIIK